MSHTTGASSSRLPIIAAAVVVVAVAIGSLVFFLGGDDPDAVDSQAALDQADAAGDDAASSDDQSLDEGDDEPAGEDTAGDDAATDDGDGADDGAADAGAQRWSVATEAVEYSFDEATGTFVGFRIDEELSNIGETEAVGRTPEVTGELTLDGSSIPAATFAGDPGALSTDRSQRDSRARAAFGDGVVEFTLTEPIDLDVEPTPGDTIATDGTGDLTVNGVTREYTVPLEASLSESGLLVVTSSFPVTLADHDVEAPRAGPVLSVSDVATVEVQLFLEQA